MCGIAGCWEFAGQRGGDALEACIRRMTARLTHRGPDGEGYLVNCASGLALGHRRLAIVGLAEGGRQPMRTADGRYALVVNGELYNYVELRKELASAGYRFAGDCDSEVMLAALATWGLEDALRRFNGMFAFAFWDQVSGELHLVRDRIGEKPLYYGWLDGCFVFGSEIKALRAHPGFDDALDGDSLARYFRYSYIGGAGSVYRAIRKLPPGMLLTLKNGARAEPRRYWSLAEVTRAAVEQPFTGSGAEAVEELDRLLRDAVRLRLRADVPVGAFLSGGVDSSTLVSMMSRETGGGGKSFSIGMPSERLDEAPRARAVAAYVGSEHRELYLDIEAGRKLIARLPDLFDEPFGDASAIPTLCVAGLARESVKTVLAGDGADEILGGYDRYEKAARLWRQTRRIPGPVRRCGGAALRLFGNDRFRATGKWLADGYPRSLHWHLVSHWKDPGPLTRDFDGHWNGTEEDAGGFAEAGYALDMLQLDVLTLLPGDLLVKVDRATMAEGVEVRLPFLDPAVVAFCLRLPAAMRNRNGQSKWVLREVLRRYVPDALIAGKKRGFSIPLADWLRGPLREWAEDLLCERRLRESGVLAVKPVREKWQTHCGGAMDHSRALWNVLMYQTWDRARRTG